MKTNTPSITIQDLHKAFLAIPNSPIAKTNYDKLALVCGMALVELRKLHEVSSHAYGNEPNVYLSKSCWAKNGLPDLTTLEKYPAQFDAVNRAVVTYIRLVHESPAFTDLLVELHAEFLAKSSGEGLGQFFTPPDLCSLVGGLQVRHMKKHGVREDMRIYEPCSGTGGTLLGTFREVLKGFPTVEHPFLGWTVVAADIDALCCVMTSLQLYANKLLHQPFGLIKVLCENSLTENLKGDCFFMSGYLVETRMAA